MEIIDISRWTGMSKIELNDKQKEFSQNILLKSMIDFLYKSKLISSQEYKSLAEYVRTK